MQVMNGKERHCESFAVGALMNHQGSSFFHSNESTHETVSRRYFYLRKDIKTFSVDHFARPKKPTRKNSRMHRHERSLASSTACLLRSILIRCLRCGRGIVRTSFPSIDIHCSIIIQILSALILLFHHLPPLLFHCITVVLLRRRRAKYVAHAAQEQDSS